MLLLTAPADDVPLPADTRGSLSFRQNGAEFNVPVPQGMCAPQGQQIEIADLIAAADDRNVTHVTMMSCNPERADTDYLMIKTPRSALLTMMEREAFLDALQAEMNLPSFQTYLQGGEFRGELEGSFAEMGFNFTINGGIRPLGRDDICVYMGGIFRVEPRAPEPSYDVAGGSCLTTVGNRPIAINYYSDQATNEGVAALAGNARALAERISVR